MVIGVLVFGFSMSQVNVGSALLVLILSIASFSGIGIMSAAMVLIVKKGDPVAAIYGALSSVLGGVWYPTTVLPHLLWIVSRFLPLTYALDAMRLAMLKGNSIYQLRVDILTLLGFTVVLTPLSLYFFQWALRKAKKEGSLIQY